jgi:4-amino-4-deoxy-L-arabinose transferase-like glycosyltransferase
VEHTGFCGFFQKLKNFRDRKGEWLTLGTFIIMALMLTFSGFKLPHYLTIIFPATAVMTASFLINRWEARKNLRPLLLTQIILCSLCLLLAGVINVWAFPVANLFVIAGFFLLLLLSGFFLLQVRLRFQSLSLHPFLHRCWCFT